MIPEYALPLNDYIRDLDAYLPGVLEPFTRDGKILALPVPGGAQGMAINLDLLEDVGYTLPPREGWTVTEFLKMAEMVKQKYGGEKWATGMFAANQSGDYLINNWFASFGVQYYKNGDYSRTTIKETGGIKFFQYVKLLNDNGYIPPGSATLTDDDYLLQWAKGQLAATAFFEAWAPVYFKTVIDQGLAKEPFNYVFYPFPKADGVPSVPTYNMTGAIIVRKTGTDADKIAARFVEYLNGPAVQEEFVKILQMPNRTDVKGKLPGDRNAEIQAIVRGNGIFDVGLTSPKFAITRPVLYPVLQKVLNGQITPEAAIDLYEKGLNEALK
jgi:ABC-type glycerol-3-phosphate transport system substrate-binding protein